MISKSRKCHRNDNLRGKTMCWRYTLRVSRMTNVNVRESTKPLGWILVDTHTQIGAMHAVVRALMIGHPKWKKTTWSDTRVQERRKRALA